MTNKDVIERLENGWTFKWIKVGSCDFLNTDRGIDVLYPQDVEDGTIYDILKDTKELIRNLKEYFDMNQPAWSDEFFILPNAGDLSAATCSTWRTLEPDEIPVVGDEARINNRWERVNIPSMWIAGGQRIEGYNFRRPIQ